MIITGVFSCDLVQRELRFQLSEPEGRIALPERPDFDGNFVDRAVRSCQSLIPLFTIAELFAAAARAACSCCCRWTISSFKRCSSAIL